MRNEDEWSPTKFELRRGKWRASRDPDHVGRGSRIIVDIIAETYAEAVTAFAHGELLDLGCGNVPLYGMYRDQCNRVVCVDWPSSQHSLPHIDLFANLNRPLPLRSGSFDTIILTDVLEHIHSPRLLLREVARLLRPQGVLILGTPFMYWLHETPHDYFRYSEYALERLANDSGLNVRVLKPYGGTIATIADLVSKLVRPSFVKTIVSGSVNTIRRLWQTKKDLRKQTGSSAFPLGYVLVADKQYPLQRSI